MPSRRLFSKPPLGAQLNRAHPLAQYLRGFWLLNEGGGTPQNLASPFNAGALGGTISPTWTTSQYGRGLNFTASGEQVNVGRGAFLDDLGVETFETLIYLRSFTGYSQRVIAKQDNSTLYNSLFINDDGSVDLARARATTRLDYVSVPGAVAAGNWYHIAATFDIANSLAAIYINGVEVSYDTTQIGAGAITSDASLDLLLGNRPGNDRTLDGIIVYARVWSIYCTPAMATELYANLYGVLSRAGLRKLASPPAPLTITPAAAECSSATVAPVVVLSNVTITPASATCTSATVAPTVQLSSVTISSAPASATSASVAPAVFLSSVTIAPVPASASAVTVAPAVIQSSVMIVPQPAAVFAVTIAPTVALSSIMIAPSPASASTQTINPAVVLSSVTISPAPASASSVTIAPSVTLGTITLTPTTVSVSAVTITPAVLLSSITFTPSPASASAVTTDPTVVIFSGGVVVTPSPVSVSAATIAPAVVLNSITFAPAPASVTTAAISPYVVLAGLSIQPLPATSGAVTVAPDVILSTIIITAIAITSAVTVDPTVVIDTGGIAVSPNPAVCTVETRTPDIKVIAPPQHITPASGIGARGGFHVGGRSGTAVSAREGVQVGGRGSIRSGTRGRAGANTGARRRS